MKRLDDIRIELESIASECRANSVKTKGEESDLLRRIAHSAEVARERVLDLSVEMTGYVQLCLDREDAKIAGVPELPDCPACHGVGASIGSWPQGGKDCRECGGTGKAAPAP